MLFKIAWRNLWRNKLRSIILVLSIVMGLWAGMFIMSFSWGMYKEHMNDVIKTQLSNFQIHNPKFQQEALVEYSISDANSIVEQLKKDIRVKAICERSKTDGMISSPTYSEGVNIVGIKPKEEKNVTQIASHITAGNYFPEKKRNEIIIGEKLAKKLRVKIKNKIVLTIQQKGGEIISGSFRIVGLFRTNKSMIDERMVYVNFQDLGTLLGTKEEVHEIAVLLKDDSFTNPIVTELRNKYSRLEIQTWKQLAPELQLIVDSFNQYMYVFIAIILVALMFGIVNTMLMAVLERQHEFGILMAIGMNKIKIFGMVLLETIVLTCHGVPVGILFTHITVEYFHKYGIDLSIFSEGMARFGFSNIIHTELEPSNYLPVSVMTVGAAILSSLYPAYKALKLKPAVAIQKI